MDISKIAQIKDRIYESSKIKVNTGKSKICIVYFNKYLKKEKYIILKNNKINYDEYCNLIEAFNRDKDKINPTVQEIKMLNNDLINSALNPLSNNLSQNIQ